MASKTENFVQQLYSKFLGRSPNTTDLLYWVGVLEAGSYNAAQATMSFVNGNEFGGVAAPVARLYYAAFGRIPDAAGLSFWMAQVKKGTSLTSIAADFVRSAEFQTLYGKTLTDSALVDALYKNVLGRSPDADGKAYWLERLGTDKMPRGDVLRAFSDSNELVASKNPEIKVVIQYQSIAGITPSKEQIAAALAENDQVSLITKLYASSTYSGVAVPYFNKVGVVVDGYVLGARVYVDKNGNHVQDANEINVTTNLQGSYSMAGQENFGGILVANGGLDISTMRESRVNYLAPPGSYSIGPLSTLQVKLAQAMKVGYPDANTRLQERLSLPAIDVSDFDPIAQAVKGGISAEAMALALGVHQRAVQVNTDVKLLIAVLQGAGITNDQQLASDLAFDAYTRLLTAEGQTGAIDLSSAATFSTLLSNAALLGSAKAETLALLTSLQDKFAALLADLNNTLSTAVDGDPIATLTRFAQYQHVIDLIAVNLRSDVLDGNIDPTLEMATGQVFADAVAAALQKIGQLHQDTTAPLLQSSVPVDNAGQVLANSNITLKFNETVIAGSGNIVLSNGTDTRTIAVTDSSQITFNADTVTINPKTDLNGGSNYYLQMESGVIRDRFGNPYAGISDKTTLNFGVPNSTIKLPNLDGTNGARYDALGPINAVAAVGDVNNDGFADFIMGGVNDTNTGISYVVLGKAAALAATNKLSSLDGRSGFKLEGVTADDFSGTSVASLGDINGDGFSDLIVGAPGADPNTKSFAGSSYVILGKNQAFGATVKLSSLDGKTGFRLDSGVAGEWVGTAVSSAGDINGDGLDDILIGAGGANGSAGASYVVYGKTTAFTNILNMASLNGVTGFKMNGVSPNDNTGSTVSAAGDFNGDGYDDMLIGAFGANSDAGAAYLVFGAAGGFAASMDLGSLDGSNGVRFNGKGTEGLGRSVNRAGDINGDGLEDIVIGAFRANEGSGAAYVLFGKTERFDPSMNLDQLSGVEGFKISGSAFEQAGIAVSAAGDVNGDGYGDLLVGARDANNKAGSTYLIYGKAGNFDANLSLGSLNGATGMRLNGMDGDRAGSSVSKAGDVNGDGFDDLVIAAPNGQGGAGVGYLFLGGNFTSAVTTQGTVKADTLTGTEASETIFGGQGDDTITGGGGADMIRGGSGADRIQIADLDFRLIDGGGGIDILKVTGAGIDIDLATLRARNIEAIDLLGSGDNSVTVTPQSVADLSSSSNRLTITGNKGDVLHLAGTWIDDGVGKDGQSYHNGSIVLIVGLAMTVNHV